MRGRSHELRSTYSYRLRIYSNQNRILYMARRVVSCLITIFIHIPIHMGGTSKKVKNTVEEMFIHEVVHPQAQVPFHIKVCGCCSIASLIGQLYFIGVWLREDQRTKTINALV